jgi:hypothetical protein
MKFILGKYILCVRFAGEKRFKLFPNISMNAIQVNSVSPSSVIAGKTHMVWFNTSGGGPGDSVCLA